MTCEEVDWLASGNVFTDCIVLSSFIMLACDGLWKAFTVETAAKFALNVLEVSNLILARRKTYFITFVNSLSSSFPLYRMKPYSCLKVGVTSCVLNKNSLDQT